MKHVVAGIIITIILLVASTVAATGGFDDLFIEEEYNDITISEEHEYTKEIIGENINLSQESQEVIKESTEDTVEYIPTIYDKANPEYVDELKEAYELKLFYDEVTDHSITIVVKDFNNYIPRHKFYELLYKIYYLVYKNYIGIEYLYDGVEGVPFNDYNRPPTTILHVYGIIPEPSNGNIYPYSNIDREEVSILLYNTYNKIRGIPGDYLNITDNSSNINDYTEISDRYKRSMLFSYQLDLLNTDFNGYIVPNKDITYEEAIIACLRLYKSIIEYLDKSDPLYNNKTNCYRLLKIYTGFNNAVISGIMASIESESGHTFDPDIHQWGGGPGYGICQWTTDSRKQGLYNYAEVCGYPYDTLECQCQYLMYELETLTPKLLKYLNEIQDTSDGAYNAAYEFCRIFEAPRDLEECCISRANNAVKYFNTYNEW